MFVPDNNEAAAHIAANTDPAYPGSSPEDGSKVFLLARKNRIDVFHLGMIEKHYGVACSTQPMDPNDLTLGHLLIEEHKANVLTACFSPDGTAITSAGMDGEVIFIKISFSDQSNANETASSAILENRMSGDERGMINKSESESPLK